MATAREQAKQVAQKVLAHDAEWWLPNLIDEAAEQVSDVWEPLLRECYDLLTWIDRPLKYALGDEESGAFFAKIQEALGEG